VTSPGDIETGSRQGVHGDEHEALRRVATLVAGGASTSELFAAVAEEAARVLAAPAAALLRYDTDGSIVVVAASRPVTGFTVGSRWSLEDATLSATVLETGQPARIDDYTKLEGSIATAVRAEHFRSSVGVPVTVDGEVWGMFCVTTAEATPFPADTEERLGNFTELVAAAISNAESHARALRLIDEQAALRRVATLAAEDPSPTELLETVATEVERVLDVAAVTVFRYSTDHFITVVGASARDTGFPIGSRWPIDGPSLAANIIESGRAARIDDYGEVPGTIAAAVRRSRFRSVVGVPIMVERTIWGLMTVASEEERLPGDTEDRLRHFTELLGTAIASIDARGGLRQLAEEQAALRRVAMLVAQRATEDELFTAVAAEVAQILDVPAVLLNRYDGGATFTVVASILAGSEAPLFSVGSRWPLDAPGLSAKIHETGMPTRVDDYSELPGRTAAALRTLRISSSVGVPITVDGALWGSMCVGATDGAQLPADTEVRLRDFTDTLGTAISSTEARHDLGVLAREQAALRRVATLVAEGADSEVVFDAVCVEMGRLIDASTVNLAHYTPDGFNLTVAGWSVDDSHVPVGTRLPLAPDTVGYAIHRTGKPSRVDSYADASSQLATLAHGRGIRTSLGAPVIVAGQLWGALLAGTNTDEPLPSGTELRVASFTDLIATAISNASIRNELISSRARIVASGDEARRRIERDLHDGVQQRLIAIGLDIQRVRSAIPDHQHDTTENLQRIGHDIAALLDDVRKLSRGLHPALLSRAGLRAALEALARTSPIPVEMDVTLTGRPPPAIETALYYVVSEALANAAKHSEASTIMIAVSPVERPDPTPNARHARRGLRAKITDDGIGGAKPASASGLVGMADRVEALGGRFTLDSQTGLGTTIAVEFPFTSDERQPPFRREHETGSVRRAASDR
jgi:signal transduction histidine kinase